MSIIDQYNDLCRQLQAALAKLDAIEARLEGITTAGGDDDEMLTVSQVAALLGRTRNAVYHLDLPRYKAGGNTSRRSAVYFRRGDVLDYMRGARVPSRKERQASFYIKALDY